MLRDYVSAIDDVIAECRAAAKESSYPRAEPRLPAQALAVEVQAAYDLVQIERLTEAHGRCGGQFRISSALLTQSAIPMKFKVALHSWETWFTGFYLATCDEFLV